MRVTLVVAVLATATAARADGSLKQAAVDKHRVDAKGLLSAAKQKALGLRQRAADRTLLLGTHRKDVRGEIAKQLWTTRKETRQLRITLTDTRGQHGVAEQTLATTQGELDAAKKAMDASHGQLSWLARNLRFAITKNGRTKLAQFRKDRGAHRALVTRSAAEQAALDDLKEQVGRFEAELGGLSQNITKQRGRDITRETEDRTNVEVAQLERAAKDVEAAAHASIRSLISGYVKGQTAAQRNPLESAKNAAKKAIDSGEHAERTIRTADGKITEAKNVETMNQLGDGLELLVGNNANDTTKALFQIGRTIGDINGTLSAQDAQRWIEGANDAAKTFQGHVDALSREAQAVQHGAGGIGGQVSKVRANVTLVNYVDLVVNLTRFDSALTDLGAGVAQQIQLARAANQLDGLRQQVSRMRAQVQGLHGALGDSLHAFDQQTGKIIDEAVAELLKEEVVN